MFSRGEGWSKKAWVRVRVRVRVHLKQSQQQDSSITEDIHGQSLSDMTMMLTILTPMNKKT